MSNPLVVAGVCVVTQGQHPLNLPFNGGVESFVRCGWSGEDVYPTGDGSHTGYLNLNDEILRVGFAKTWTPCLLIGLHLRDPWNPGVSYSSVFHWVRGVYIFFYCFICFFWVKFLRLFCFSGMDSILTPIRVNFPMLNSFPQKNTKCGLLVFLGWGGPPASNLLVWGIYQNQMIWEEKARVFSSSGWRWISVVFWGVEDLKTHSFWFLFKLPKIFEQQSWNVAFQILNLANLTLVKPACFSSFFFLERCWKRRIFKRAPPTQQRFHLKHHLFQPLKKCWFCTRPWQIDLILVLAPRS